MNRYRDDGDQTRRGELKSSSSQLLALIPEADVDQLAETLVAFANADGGTIYLGVAEGGVPTGEVFPEEIEVTVQQAELRCRPPVRVEWGQWEAGGSFVFVGQVQRSPVLHVLDDGRVLVRTGDQNHLLSDPQIQRMAASRSVGDYEVEPAVGMSRVDLDDEVLREFVQVWEERQGRQLTRPLDDFLMEMGWLLPDGQPTVAGFLLFGKNPSTFLPRCGVTFIRFEGNQLRGPDGGASYG
ncbi:MAG: putative DNA binding domain-containing protein [Anaerolineae bacterium]|nr:putative DNA binding domain-containing protein [Anaerolineae bacterium]